MAKILQLLDTDSYSDVAPMIRKSGFMGSFGWPMLGLVVSHRRDWKSLNAGFIWQLGKRSAEVIGRRYFPDWLARLALRTFYRHA
jgi:hypothetical protein